MTVSLGSSGALMVQQMGQSPVSVATSADISWVGPHLARAKPPHLHILHVHPKTPLVCECVCVCVCVPFIVCA